MGKTGKLSSLGEFGLINRISAGVDNGVGVITGIGDDAAVTELTDGMQLLVSTDMLLEDRHFRTLWHDPQRLGAKSLAVSISDIAAMGGIPRWALLSIAFPGKLPVGFVDQFMLGFLDVARKYGVSLIGGDTCSSKSGIVVSVTIMGEQYPGLVVRRSGASAGDQIWVSGTLGDAALGLALLEGDRRFSGAGAEGDSVALLLGGDEVVSLLAGRLLDPQPRVLLGQALAASGLVTAMIDVSDGILADFGHIAEQSCVGGEIVVERLPVSERFRQTVARVSPFPFDLLLSGGEDYELAFTAKPSDSEKIKQIAKKCGIAVSHVGIVTASPEVVAVSAGGTRYNPQVTGFNHFN